MRSILISHSNQEPDKTISLNLYNYLSERNIDCWIDAKLKVGNWKKQIGTVMDETTIVIFVASNNSFGSPEVMGEVGYYRNTANKIIVPFVLDKQGYININSKYPEAIYIFGSNSYQAVFAEDHSTIEQAFDRLVHLLPDSVSRLENNPAHFEYANGGDKILTRYSGEDACVTIPSYVNEIAREAFMNNKSLKKVIIPPSIKTIGIRAFYGCRNLIAVEGMEGVTEVEVSAFKASGVAPCKENGYMVNGVVFDGEETDSTITIHDGVRVIANEAFRYCGAEQVKLPQGLQSIGAVAFAESIFLTNLQIPATVTWIGKNAFRGCTRLQKVTFEGNIPEGAEEAFDNLQQLIKTEDK